MANPKVSCLCTTRIQRWGSLQRAILDFCRQTYGDAELIIVVSTDDHLGMVQTFTDQIRGPGQPLGTDLNNVNVKVFKRPIRNPIDGLTYALCQAGGEIVTIWDDDNTNAPERLERQVATQKEFPQVLTAFSESMYFFHDSVELFVCDYMLPTAAASERVAVSTLMGYRDNFPPTTGAFRSRPAAQMVDGLGTLGLRLMPIPALPFLHCVGVTRDNLRGYELHRRLAQTRGQSSEWLKANEAGLREAIAKYRWDSSTMDVTGPDAAGFNCTDLKRWPAALYPVSLTNENVQVVREHLLH